MSGLDQRGGAVEQSASRGFGLAMGALGVVYGDIGTSPLYTMKTALEWGGGVVPAVALGMLSLIIWTLILTVSVKYVALVMRADNEGEGGILALMSQLGLKKEGRPIVVALGILGAALLYGDGAITPAISVLSALEGLKDPLPAIASHILPIATAILVGLFLLQRQGTASIGRLFGPVMLGWFLLIGLLGLIAVFAHPGVLLAFDPRVGLGYLAGHGLAGVSVLGAVFLSVTGAEALYADMGHFGVKPIRFGWYGLVLPALLLNYAGQAALVVAGEVQDGENPFFLLTPEQFRLPMVVLATVATIIASQAVISGAFSMTRQAIQLGLLPRMTIVQTSDEGYGQIYVGFVNWTLMVFTIGLTVTFGSSDNLAAAYGVAVATTMLMTTMLMFVLMREVWNWGRTASLAVAGSLGAIDLLFVGANMTKIAEGGWVPLVAGSVIFVVMFSWYSGRATVLVHLKASNMPIGNFISSVLPNLHRVPGTAVYLTRRQGIVPMALVNNLKHYKAVHERLIIVHVETQHIPRIPRENRATVSSLGEGFWLADMHYGFMEHPNLPRALGRCDFGGEPLILDDTTFFLAKETIIIVTGSWTQKLIYRLYAFMHRNAADASAFFRVPPDRTVEFGSRLVI
jgi:KUP system potassium uptake protein